MAFLWPIINKIISKMISYKDKWFDMIEKSFLNSDFKEQYKSLLTQQISKLK